MRIIAKRQLREFWSVPGHRAAEAPLRAWYRAARPAAWSGPADVKASFRTASILRGNRVVFNIAGNRYRLVVRIHYTYGVVYVRFVGTHRQYDSIDAETV